MHDFPDRAIRQALQQPANLRELLQEVVPDLAAGFDCDRATLLDREFPLEDWRRRESDLLFRIPYRSAAGEQPTLVCVMIEHQSAPDLRMPLRTLLYAVLYWEREWKAWEESPAPRPPFCLSPVVPIVFHTGSSPWGSGRAIADLIAGPEGLRAFAPKWQPLFWDLALHTPEALLQAAGDWLRALAVVRAEVEDADTFRRVFGEALRHLEALSMREEIRWYDLVRFVLSWGLQRRPREERDELVSVALASQSDASKQKEVQTMGQTIAEALKEEGKLEGLRETLREQLTDRFGTLPPGFIQRIEAATDLGKLRGCLRQVLRVNSLEELPL